VTQQLGTRIPRDVVVEMITDKRVYVIRGPTTKNPQNAATLTPAELTASVQAFLHYMLTLGMRPALKPGDLGPPPSLRISLIVGHAYQTTSVRWDESARGELTALAHNPDDPFYTLLVAPLLSRIKDIGAMLFSPAATTGLNHSARQWPRSAGSAD